ncbi:pentapeptide repeat-containing protein [Streptomyces sp. yr375]|uniref:pentapeptide repeat-containing protein n=1 Tax=Streptomyces sp. yr375 TaxID=1761906 RepID=UPI003527CB70
MVRSCSRSLSAARPECAGLSGARLSGAGLSGARLSGAGLSGAGLSGAAGISPRAGRASAVAVRTPAPSRARRCGSSSAWVRWMSLRTGSASQAGSTSWAGARVKPASWAVMRLPRRRERHSSIRAGSGGRGWVPSSQRRAVVRWTVNVRPCSAAMPRRAAANWAGPQPAASKRSVSWVLAVRGTAASWAYEHAALLPVSEGGGPASRAPSQRSPVRFAHVRGQPAHW